jgi:hypothetical protein
MPCRSGWRAMVRQRLAWADARARLARGAMDEPAARRSGGVRGLDWSGARERKTRHGSHRVGQPSGLAERRTRWVVQAQGQG